MFGSPLIAFADHGAGRLLAARATQIQSHLSTLYGPAVLNQPLYAGDGVRTMRRGYADIKFADSSEIRLNERTDLVIEDSNTMRRYALAEGAMWVRVAKGVRTVVRTPVGTATARGTVFVVSANGTLTVLEGTVEFQVGGQTTLVHAGQSVTFSPQTQTFTNVQDPYTVVQPDTGFTSNGWFDHPGDTLFTEAGDTTYLGYGTRDYYDIGDEDGGLAGGIATPLETVAGFAAMAGGVEAGSQFFLLTERPGHFGQPAPEPGIPLALSAGLGLFAIRRRKRSR